MRLLPRVTACLLVTFVFGALAQENLELCQPRLATLAPSLGVFEDASSGPRVEIRRCPFDSAGNGTIQLAAWKQAAKSPSLVFNSTGGGIRQLAMIQGVYAVEFLGGIATRVVVIEFDQGVPRLALDTDSKSTFTITSNPSRLVIQWTDYSGRAMRREFQSRP